MKLWGNPKKTRLIRLQGMERPVTTNLEVALRFLRLKDKERVLWIDAMCIDQSKHQGKESSSSFDQGNIR